MEQRKAKLPQIGSDDSFVTVVKTMSNYFISEINLPHTFEQLRTTSAGNSIRTLVDHLVSNVTNRAIINALLTLKWHFDSLDDERGINETRANACEIVAWRFLSRISERDAVDLCLYDLPRKSKASNRRSEQTSNHQTDEYSSLLPQYRPTISRSPTALRQALLRRPTMPRSPTAARQALLRSRSQIFERDEIDEDDEEDPTSAFTGLNGLEIAAVADCKRFLCQRAVQKIVTGIWNGDITFWANLSEHTQKKPQFYNNRKSDPFTRLRVPRYIKIFEVVFFASFIALFYGVLVERNPYHVTALEIFLDIWFAAYAYDELSEFIDAGSIFYAVDIWNSCDIIIILIGMAFFVCRVIGLAKNSTAIIDTSFDILSLEALFMVPRLCSIFSLHPYFGTLVPALKGMAKDFVKFMVIVAILYMGFLTTFTLLARDSITPKEMSWILVRVFFGSSYLGFDIMNKISPQLGPPLMLTFVCMTNILLLTSLISILSDTFSKIQAHAREEYLFVYSVYVLEASTSNRLTHFYPPFNLIPLIFLRPSRLLFSAYQVRRARILLLKATHIPIVGCIFLFELFHSNTSMQNTAFSSIGPSPGRSLGTNNSTKKQPFLSKTTKMKADSQHFATGPPDRANGDSPLTGSSSFEIVNRSGTGLRVQGADGTDESINGAGVMVVEEKSSNESLEEKVGVLSDRIEHLMALVMAGREVDDED